MLEATRFWSAAVTPDKEKYPRTTFFLYSRIQSRGKPLVFFAAWPKARNCGKQTSISEKRRAAVRNSCTSLCVLTFCCSFSSRCPAWSIWSFKRVSSANRFTTWPGQTRLDHHPTGRAQERKDTTRWLIVWRRGQAERESQAQRDGRRHREGRGRGEEERKSSLTGLDIAGTWVRAETSWIAATTNIGQDWKLLVTGRKGYEPVDTSPFREYTIQRVGELPPTQQWFSRILAFGGKVARTSACSSLWRSASLSIVRLMPATLLCKLSLRESSFESLCD